MTAKLFRVCMDLGPAWRSTLSSMHANPKQFSAVDTQCRGPGRGATRGRRWSD